MIAVTSNFECQYECCSTFCGSPTGHPSQSVTFDARIDVRVSHRLLFEYQTLFCISDTTSGALIVKTILPCNLHKMKWGLHRAINTLQYCPFNCIFYWKINIDSDKAKKLMIYWVSAWKLLS